MDAIMTVLKDSWMMIPTSVFLVILDALNAPL
jgi:hypothetical protein